MAELPACYRDQVIAEATRFLNAAEACPKTRRQRARAYIRLAAVLGLYFLVTAQVLERWQPFNGYGAEICDALAAVFLTGIACL